ncbi:MAG: tRNA 2-thiouridine(34) synthase MnmA [Planctomycetes bacterium]|nr:tRNA 2-thiouridine(34) synthase MnmA [Planctomycetota bacterium]
MSGGVDSSVAAAILAAEGHEVIGLFMRLGHQPVSGVERSRGCCSARDADDARRVAGILGIPFYSLNFEEEFGRIVDDFAGEYARARTPNPCVRCNQWLKFGRLLETARELGAEAVATGHYVRRVDREGSLALARARDLSKDQSYYLFALGPGEIAAARFPVGDLEKSKVREVAREHGFPNADKPESQDICFVPDGDYRPVVQAVRPDSFRPGEIRDTSGRLLGTHSGVAAFTIGQRRGVGVAAGHPLYVVELDAETNTVVVGTRDELARGGLLAAGVLWTTGQVPAPGTELRCAAQVRYNHRPGDCTVRMDASGGAEVLFDRPESAVTPGQAVVFYEGDVVLGGGWIDSALPVAVRSR